MKSKLTNSITNRILAMKLAGEFMLIYPIYIIMLTERGGVDASGVSIIVATGLVLSVLFEIPTGVIADKWPRKYVIASAISCRFLMLLSWLLWPSFWGYIIGVAFYALGTALESGALQAYLYGALGEESKLNFGKFWARVNAMVMCSFTIAYTLPTIIGINYPLLIVLSMVGSLTALGICLTLPRDKIVHVPGEKPQIFASAVGHITKTPALMRILLGAIVVVGLAELAIEYISLYYHQVGIATRYVPVTMAVTTLTGGILFWTLHSWEGFLNKYKLPLLVLVTLLFIASFRGGVITAAIGLLVFTRFTRLLQVQFEANVQHLSNEQARATITSIGAFGAKLLAAGIALVIGATAVNQSIVQPFRIALIAGAVVFALLQLGSKYRDRKVTI